MAFFMSIPSPLEQRDIIKKIALEPKKEEKAYVINSNWLNIWKENVGFDSDNSEPKYEQIDKKIDNTDVIADGKIISWKNHNIEFRFICQSAWEKLFEWFGGGPDLYFDTIEVDGQVHVLYQVITVSIKYGKDIRDIKTNQYEKVDEIRKKALILFEIEQEQDSRLINYDNDMLNLVYDDLKLLGNYKGVDQLLYLDTKDQSGVWDSERLRYPLTSRFYSSERVKSNLIISKYPSTNGGKCGLNNIGNTCFFNAGLQCMLHTRLLMRYILTNEYRKELNKDNPMGMSGEIVEAFASLAKEVWSTSRNSVSPNNMKSVISEYAPQFRGYNQHDSHELINCVLDGIHEDLNRCFHKQMHDMVFSDGTNDQEIAQKAWCYHKARNDSIIVDLMQGQLRSQCDCPKCKCTTVAFDPYLTLSLPLVLPKQKVLSFTFVPANFKEPYQNVQINTPKERDNDTIDRLVSEKLNRPVHVAIANINKTSKSIQWGLSQTEGKADYFMFEIPDIEKLYVPCSITIKGDCYRNVTLAYVLVEYDENLADPIVDKGKELLQFIWDEEEISTTDKMNHILTKLNQNIDKKSEKTIKLNKGFGKIQEPTKPYRNVTKKLYEIEVITTHDLKLNNLLIHPEVYYEGQYSRSKTSSLTLKQCFEFFRTPELLDDENLWRCPSCKEFVNATKRVDIWSIPDVLVIQLKRFTTTGINTRKDDTVVDFDDVIDLTDYVVGPKDDKPIRYSLFATSNHMGGLSGGHYTANAKVQDPFGPIGDNGTWYNFNDSYSYPCDSINAHSQYAYALFYERIYDDDERVKITESQDIDKENESDDYVIQPMTSIPTYEKEKLMEMGDEVKEDDNSTKDEEVCEMSTPQPDDAKSEDPTGNTAKDEEVCEMSTAQPDDAKSEYPTENTAKDEEVCEMSTAQPDDAKSEYPTGNTAKDEEVCEMSTAQPENDKSEDPTEELSKSQPPKKNTNDSTRKSPSQDKRIKEPPARTKSSDLTKGLNKSSGRPKRTTSSNH